MDGKEYPLPPWIALDEAKRKAVSTFGEFRILIDRTFDPEHIGMETSPLDAVRVMGHYCRWILMSDYDIELKWHQHVFEIAGIAGAHRVKTDIIRIEESHA